MPPPPSLANPRTTWSPSIPDVRHISDDVGGGARHRRSEASPAKRSQRGAERGNLDWDGELLLADLVVFLLLIGRPQTLPGQAAAQEVEEHVSQRLQVVPPPLQ